MNYHFFEANLRQFQFQFQKKVSYVQKKYNLNFYEALKVISNDFNLGLHTGEVVNKTMGYEGVHITKQPRPIATDISSI